MESRETVAPPQPDQRRTRPIDRFAWFAFPLVSGVLAVVAGQDASGDQLMYHFYGPYALLHGRLGIDIAPAGMGTFNDPLMYVPLYLATRVLPAPLVGFLIGAVQGMSGSLLYEIGRRVLPISPFLARTLALFAAAAGIRSATNQFEIGATHFDNVVVVPVIAACLVAMISAGRRWMLLAAGILVGASTGAKLTAIIHAVAFVPALILAGHVRVRRALLAAVGIAVGFVVTAAPFMISMYRHYGSPLFPHYNGLFRSPYFPAETLGDSRWAFHSLREFALSPLAFVSRHGRLFEYPFFDPRWIVFASALLVAALSWKHLSTAARFLVLFVFGSYVVWAAQWAYLRYLVGAELLAMVAVVAVLVEARRGRAWPVVFAGFACFVVAVATHAPASPRIPWGRSWFLVDAPRFEHPEDVAILLEGEIAFAVPFFQPEITFVGLNNNFFGSSGKTGRLFDRAVEIAHSKTVYHLGQQGWPDRWKAFETDTLYQSIGLMLDRERCRPVRVNIRPFELCPVVPYRTGARSRAAVTLAGSPPAMPQGGHVDAVHIRLGEIAIEGWAAWSGFHGSQQLHVYGDAPLEVMSFESVPRFDVAAAFPDGLLGRAGFRVRLRPHGDPHSLCLHSEDPQIGERELPFSAEFSCDRMRLEAREASGDPRAVRPERDAVRVESNRRRAQTPDL